MRARLPTTLEREIVTLHLRSQRVVRRAANGVRKARVAIDDLEFRAQSSRTFRKATDGRERR